MESEHNPCPSVISLVIVTIVKGTHASEIRPDSSYYRNVVIVAGRDFRHCLFSAEALFHGSARAFPCLALRRDDPPRFVLNITYT